VGLPLLLIKMSASLYVAVVVLVRSRFQAAEHSCRAQTFPYILIHFCLPRPHPIELTPPPNTPLSVVSNSKKQQPPAGEVFPSRCFAFPIPPYNNFFCTMNFCAFSTCMSCKNPPFYSPPLVTFCNLPKTKPWYLPSICIVTRKGLCDFWRNYQKKE